MIAARNAPTRRMPHTQSPACGRTGNRVTTARVPAPAWVLSVFLSLLLPGLARGGPLEPAALPHHNGETLICSDCHRFSLGVALPAAAVDGSRGQATGVGAQAEAGATGSTHLITADLNQLCLNCHDGVRGIPDVLGNDVNGMKERSAGLFEPAGSSNRSGHDLGGQITCVSCHDPHGNGQARNLRLPSDPDASPGLGLFVRESAVRLHRYERQNVAYGAVGTPALLELSGLCVDCHGGLAGERIGLDGGHEAFLLHPSYDSRNGATNTISQGGAGRTTSPTHWNFGSGPDFALLGRVPFLTTGAADFSQASEVDAGRNAVFCLSCHKAHGSEHRYSLRWDQTGESGKAGCNQCHDKDRGYVREQLTERVR